MRRGIDDRRGGGVADSAKTTVDYLLLTSCDARRRAEGTVTPNSSNTPDFKLHRSAWYAERARCA